MNTPMDADCTAAGEHALYEITRCAKHESVAQKIERVQMLQCAGGLRISEDAVGDSFSSADTDPLAVIVRNPRLGTVHAHDEVHISADAAVASHLPLILTVVSDSDDLDTLRPEDWDVTINDVPVAPFKASNGRWHVLPVDDSWLSVEVQIEWVEINFCEMDSMSSGDNKTRIGLATASVVVAVTDLDTIDGEQPPVEVYAHGNDQTDAQLVANWLRDNALLTYLEDIPQLLMAKLFIDAVASNPTGRKKYTTYGDELSAPFGLSYQDEAAGCTSSSEWTVTLNLSQSMRDGVIHCLVAGSDEASRLVKAAGLLA